MELPTSERPERAGFRIAILIVGFRNPGDIQDCLVALSTLSREPSFDIFICENGGEESFEQLCQYLVEPDGACMPAHSDVTISAPTDRLIAIRRLSLRTRSSSNVWIAKACENLGYAGAVNALLSYLRNFQDWQGIWILNPDTRPDTDALRQLQVHALIAKKGMVGSTVLASGSDDEYIQCRAGLHWRRLTMRAKLIGYGEHLTDTTNSETIEKLIDCVSGASMYVTKECVDYIGLMEEKYFLYYEDLDWSLRAKPLGLGYASKSVVWHTGGTTIGSGSRSRSSFLSVYLENRNRILFVRKFFPRCALLASIQGFLYSTEFLLVGRPAIFGAALRGLLAGLRGEVGRPAFLDLPR